MDFGWEDDWLGGGDTVGQPAQGGRRSTHSVASSDSPPARRVTQQDGGAVPERPLSGAMTDRSYGGKLPLRAQADIDYGRCGSRLQMDDLRCIRAEAPKVDRALPVAASALLGRLQIDDLRGLRTTETTVRHRLEMGALGKSRPHTSQGVVGAHERGVDERSSSSLALQGRLHVVGDLRGLRPGSVQDHWSGASGGQSATAMAAQADLEVAHAFLFSRIHLEDSRRTLEQQRRPHTSQAFFGDHSFKAEDDSRPSLQSLLQRANEAAHKQFQANAAARLASQQQHQQRQQQHQQRQPQQQQQQQQPQQQQPRVSNARKASEDEFEASDFGEEAPPSAAAVDALAADEEHFSADLGWDSLPPLEMEAADFAQGLEGPAECDETF